VGAYPSVCIVSKANPKNLEQISNIILENGYFSYYPGQRVRARWEENRLEGIVTNMLQLDHCSFNIG
jgi:hypothetical protein